MDIKKLDYSQLILLADSDDFYNIVCNEQKFGEYIETLHKTYCKEKNVEWIEDPMNDDEDFARVKIRKFLPNLKKIGIDEKCLAETAKKLRARNRRRCAVTCSKPCAVRRWICTENKRNSARTVCRLTR